MKNNKFLPGLIGIGLVIIVAIGYSGFQYNQKLAAERDKQEAKQLFEELAKNPAQLFKTVKSQNKNDAVLQKMKYKDSKDFKNLINKIRRVTDDQDTKTLIAKAEAGDKSAKKQNDAVIDLMSTEKASKQVRADLGILNNPSESGYAWKWFIGSKDLVFKNQENKDQIYKYLFQQMKKFCIYKDKDDPRDCRVHSDTKIPIQGKANFTIVPVKVKTEPLTYRMFIFERTYIIKNSGATSQDAATQRAIELEKDTGT